MRQKKGRGREHVGIARAYAEEKLTPRLLDHARECADEARRLARGFGVDEYKVACAAYLHDVAKPLTRDEQAAMAREMGMTTAEIGFYPPAVLHGPLAALIARNELGIDDPDVLEAVEVHSTGCAGMGEVAKVVFIADYIEPTRKFPGSAGLRDRFANLDKATLNEVTLNEATLEILNRKLEHLREEGKTIDPRALALLKELRTRLG